MVGTVFLFIYLAAFSRASILSGGTVLQSRRGEDSVPMSDRRMTTVKGKQGASSQSGDSEAKGERAV